MKYLYFSTFFIANLDSAILRDPTSSEREIYSEKEIGLRLKSPITQQPNGVTQLEQTKLSRNFRETSFINNPIKRIRRIELTTEVREGENHKTKRTERRRITLIKHYVRLKARTCVKIIANIILAKLEVKQKKKTFWRFCMKQNSPPPLPGWYFPANPRTLFAGNS